MTPLSVGQGELNLGVQLTVFQSGGGQIMPTTLHTAYPPGFKNLMASLRCNSTISVRKILMLVSSTAVKIIHESYKNQFDEKLIKEKYFLATFFSQKKVRI